MEKFLKITFSIFVLLANTSCQNVFEKSANKGTDEALYEDAQKAMDASSWDEAISKFSSMGAGFKSKPEVIEQWAGAYAGKCGLNFVNYFTSLGSSSLTGSTLFKYFMNQFTNVSVSAQHCSLAQAKMEELGATSAQRNASQNLFMAILGMVKVGAYLREITDKDGSGLGDGTMDAGFDLCDNTQLTNANLNEIITGMGLITSNLTYVTVALGGSAGGVGTALGTLNTICTGGACGQTSAAALTATERDLFRDMLGAGVTNPGAQIGIGTCVDPTVVGCCAGSGG